MVTVQAERAARADNREMLASERPGAYSAVSWSSATTSTPTGSRPTTTGGVLTLTIPVAEQAKARKIEITHSDDRKAVSA